MALAHPKRQGQNHAHSDCRYIVNGNGYNGYYYFHLIESHTLAYLYLILAESKGQVLGRAYFNCRYVIDVTNIPPNITIDFKQKVIHWLSIGDRSFLCLTLFHCRGQGQGQGHAYFDCKYLLNGNE